MDLDSRKEIVFFYESIRANPNGDPGFDNQPRMYPDNTVMVTDVRIKRTIRDYAKKASDGKGVIFVDYDDNGDPIEADGRAIEILKKYDKWNPGANKKSLAKKDANRAISGLLRKTFDVPLFGALVTLRDKSDPGSAQITGPCQFGMGKSVNEAEIITNQISSHFVGDEKKRHGTFGTDYVIDYALIKTVATINPTSLELGRMESRLGDSKAIDEIKANFYESESKLLHYLWAGTNGLVSRSKFQQRSVLAVEVEYDRSYVDLDTLIDAEDTKKPKEHATDLADIEFGFERLVSTLGNRAKHVKGVRMACDPRLDKLVDAAAGKIPNAKKVDLSG